MGKVSSSQAQQHKLLPPARGAQPELPEGTPGQAGRAGFIARLQKALEAHSRLTTWLFLAIGMVAILLWTSRDTDLLFSQRLVLVLATVGLAGLCAWIMGWE